MADHRTLLELVRSQNVLVCVGSGGVGKTTVSAAIAMHAAQLGRTACVLTIDPARRLANSLGLNELGNRPTRVEDARFDAAGLPRPSGRLFAMMLDTKRTWDDLVHRFAPSDEQARRILDNRYYQNISGALAGSQEFMAMEKLYELHESGAYELLVLDTPPTQHALDFLDSPKR
jgi:Oxyanion-translocating ATPase